MLISEAYAKDGILVNAISPASIETPPVERMVADQATVKRITVQQAE
jgi:NAD(P)-dependent dehydrogenase (short-subunit alcohol dehydrogenase family)